MKIKIIDAQRDVKSGVIKSVTWFASVETDDGCADYSQTTELESITPFDSAFIDFDKVTEKMIINWIGQQISLPTIEYELKQQIKNRKSMASGLPWQS